MNAVNFARDRAGELVPAGDVGQGGTAELAEGADDHARLQRAAIVKAEVPDRAVFVEPGRRDAAAQTQVRAKAALPSATSACR